MEMLQSWYPEKKILLNFEWDLKFYFLHMKSKEAETSLKLLVTINGNVKILSKTIEIER